MRPTLLLSFTLALVPCLAACSAPFTGLAKAQETAQTFNLDSRFGRTEMVLDQVKPPFSEYWNEPPVLIIVTCRAMSQLVSCEPSRDAETPSSGDAAFSGEPTWPLKTQL